MRILNEVVDSSLLGKLNVTSVLAEFCSVHDGHRVSPVP